MKIILSRKGFDSGMGKIPSPIFDNGDFFSLPIPSDGEGSIPFSHIQYGNHNVGNIVEMLSKNKISSTHTCHYDPDLIKEGLLKRDDGWKPLFGQSGSAQGHLQNNNISKGDIFIFYGWFQNVRLRNGILSYDKTKGGVHVIFGWLQIGKIISVNDKENVPIWAKTHPHFNRETKNKNDVVYISSDELELCGKKTGIKGAGHLKKFDDRLVLSKSGEKRSIWELPLFFYPDDLKKPLTYNENIERWKKENDKCILNSANRGQEFVIDCDDYPEIYEWLLNLVKLDS